MILSGNSYYFQIPNKSCFPASMSKREIKSLMLLSFLIKEKYYFIERKKIHDIAPESN